MHANVEVSGALLWAWADFQFWMPRDLNHCLDEIQFLGLRIGLFV
jgi:hypothetical protein